MLLDRIAGLFSSDMGIDLGTANTVVALRGRGIVLDEPSVVAAARDGSGERLLAVGSEAKRMLGRTPGEIRAVRPLRDGVIADFDAAETMIKYFIRKVHHRQGFVSPRIVVSVPSGATPVERRAIREAAESAGAREVFLIEEPMAAAIGAGLPVNEPRGSMVADIGGGTTEVAVISLGGLAYARTVRTGGDKMDAAITAHARRELNLLIGEETAERIKIEVGTALRGSGSSQRRTELRGRDVAGSTPKAVEIDESFVAEALKEPIEAIVEAVRDALEHTPPELAADIVQHGIVLTGGGALLGSLETVLRQRTGLPVFVAEEPLLCVANGTARCAQEIEAMRRVPTQSVLSAA